MASKCGVYQPVIAAAVLETNIRPERCTVRVELSTRVIHAWDFSLCDIVHIFSASFASPHFQILLSMLLHNLLLGFTLSFHELVQRSHALAQQLHLCLHLRHNGVGGLLVVCDHVLELTHHGSEVLKTACGTLVCLHFVQRTSPSASNILILTVHSTTRALVGMCTDHGVCNFVVTHGAQVLTLPNVLSHVVVNSAMEGAGSFTGAARALNHD